MKATYRVSGMTCGGCVRAVTNAIKMTAPAAKIAVDLPAGMVTVEGDVDETSVADAIEGAGFVFDGRVSR